MIYLSGVLTQSGALQYVRNIQLMSEESRVHDEPAAWTTFEEEVLPHSDRLFRLAMWLERNRADAEDAVQETMVQAMRSFHRYQPGTNCRAWLITILQRIVSNRRRARGRSILVSDPDDRIAETVPFVPPVPQELTDELVLGSLRQLPLVFQEVILLCDVEDLSYKEAAEALDVPVGTVMSRLHRARARLRASLTAADPLPVSRPAMQDQAGIRLQKVEVS
jgi:RNA polymerase sigma-70 factor, ECF subfamily